MERKDRKIKVRKVNKKLIKGRKRKINKMR
jgi:hypothetical protein